jgi:Zn-dependent peptidase ImmA (M78 family)/transcriptional regulator with XRE-family HTH domain
MVDAIEFSPPARSLGFRIKAAREALSLNQDQVCDALGLKDRQTISAIELGERQVKPAELVQLSRLLKRDIEYFVDPFVVAGEAQFSWRADDAVPSDALDAFEARAGRWIGLLRFLRNRQAHAANPFGKVLRLTKRASYEDALATGEAVAQTLDLGCVPAHRLMEKIETVLDIPVLFVDAIAPSQGGGISGATCHLPDLGVILIDRNEPQARRHFDLAHELFHVLTWDAMRPDHRESNSSGARSKSKRVEELANNFASALLMPRACLAKLIDDRRIGDVSHLAEVANQLQVSASALAWRLFNANMIDATTRFALCQVTASACSALPPKRFSASFVELLHSGIHHGHVAARKAAKALDLTLPELSELFAEHSKPAPFTV